MRFEWGPVRWGKRPNKNILKKRKKEEKEGYGKGWNLGMGVKIWLFYVSGEYIGGVFNWKRQIQMSYQKFGILQYDPYDK